MEATTTPAPSAERTRSDILASLASLDAQYRASVNACRHVDAVAYKSVGRDGSHRMCVTNPIDVRALAANLRKSVSAGRRPIPTQRCTRAERVESAEIGQGGQR